MIRFKQRLLLFSIILSCRQSQGNPVAGGAGVDRRSVHSEEACEITVSDMKILLLEGQNYTAGCDFYECVGGDVVTDIHPCEKKLDYSEYNICHKWSADRCCCEVIGCEDVHGVVRDNGTWYQTKPSPNPDKPDCGEHCLCEGGPLLSCRLDLTCLSALPEPLPSA